MQFLLLGLVILIWGMLIYRIFAYLKKSDAVIPEQDYAFSPLYKDTAAADTFFIRGGYPDPFLGPQKEVNSGLVQGKNQAKSAGKTAQSRFGTNTPMQRDHSASASGFSASNTSPPLIIAYRGFSINDNRITRVRLDISGKSHTLKLAETWSGVTLLEMTRDSVVVDNNGQRQTVHRVIKN